MGNVFAVPPNEFHLVLERWAERYGSAYTFRLFNNRFAVFSDYAAVDAALRARPETFRRLASMQRVIKEITFGSDGLFGAEGDAWRRQRHTVARALDAPHVRRFFPRLCAIAQRLKTRWAKAASNASLDLYSGLSRFTVDVTTDFAFGYDANTLESDDDTLQRHLARVFPIINRRMTLPFPYWRYVKLRIDRETDRSIAYIKERIGAMVERSRSRLSAANPADDKPSNLMDIMLAAERDGEASFSTDELLANIFTMLLAGEDTTAATLAWTLHFVAHRPDVQSRLRSEANAVGEARDGTMTVDDLDRLRYHDAVISETMRLKPIGPLGLFQTNVATTLDGVELPAETLVILNARAATRARNGEGAREFEPERWLGTRAASAPADFAFGGGPRFCPGRSLAMAEMKVALSTIVRSFTIEPDASDDAVREEFSFVMMPKNARVRLKCLAQW